MLRISKILKRKLIVMTLLIAGFTTHIVAQTQKNAFKISPELSQGFIVLNDIDSVDSWSIEIENRTLLNVSDPNARIKTKLKGFNYFKMPDNYDVLNHSIIINVNGYSNNNELIISDDNVIQNDEVVDPMCYPCPNQKFEQCKWVCNGNGYAYEIVSYAEDDISSPFLRLERTVDELGIPYYNYMSYAQFHGQCSNNAPQGTIGSCIIDNVVNIKIENTGQQNYVDAMNNPITGTVYGVAKNLGPWEGPIVSTGVLGGHSGPGCGQMMQWAINGINNASGPDGTSNRITHYGMPNLECIPAFQPHSGSSGTSYDMNCLNSINFVFGENNDGDIFDYLNEVSGCYGEKYEKWWENLSEISIQNISGDGSNGTTIISQDLFNRDGKARVPSINLDPGLYSIATVSAENGHYFPVIKEVKDSLTSGMDQSDFFTANIYPNPVIRNDFNLEMSVDATLEFKFRLTTIQGVLVLDKKFLIRKGKTLIENIKGTNNSPIPQGALVGTFIFKDGSSKSYNIIKN